jgi:hypothetical protein
MLETIVEYAIRYRRPETPGSLAGMTVPNGDEAALQVKRLLALGYKVVDVVPPLDD